MEMPVLVRMITKSQKPSLECSVCAPLVLSFRDTTLVLLGMTIGKPDQFLGGQVQLGDSPGDPFPGCS